MMMVMAPMKFWVAPPYEHSSFSPETPSSSASLLRSLLDLLASFVQA